MSVQAMAAVFNHSASKGSARLVLLAMADEANAEGELTAYRRSQSWLARKANVDKGTVSRSIDKLVELGEVVVLRVGDGRASTDYQLVLPGLGEPIEGRQPAPPGSAAREPRVGEVHPQGGQDADPIIPVLPGMPPVSPNSRDRFDDFWQAFPVKRGKPQARDAWRVAVAKVGGDAQRIIDAAAAYRDDPNRDPSFTKYAQGWLSGERWNDPPLPPRDGAPKRSTREQRIMGRPDGPARLAEALGLDTTTDDRRPLPPGGNP